MVRQYQKKVGGRAYQSYTREQLKAAIDAVNTKTFSMREAHRHFKIPLGTLSHHMRGKHAKLTGGQRVFSDEEERVFVQHVLSVSQWGFPFDIVDIQVLVKSYLERTNRRVQMFANNTPSRDWVRNFISRQKDLSQRMCQNIKVARAAVTPEVVTEYFEHLRVALDIDGNAVPPENLFNYDETNLSDDPGSKVCVFKRGVKYPERVINSSKGNISIMFCGSACGNVLPVYVVYKGEHLWSTWLEGGPVKTSYNRSKSGWFDATLFTDWFEKVFVPVARTKTGRVVIIGDNLASHFTERVVELSAQNNISFICLPKNSTHICQPLDIAFFRPLKMAWRKVLENWKVGQGRKAQCLSKDVFPRLLKSVLCDVCSEPSADGTMTCANVSAGFAAAGIWPYNPEKVLKRLPGTAANRVTEEKCATVVSEVVVDMLKDMRESGAKHVKQRRTRINVTAGRSITMEDFRIANEPTNVQKDVTQGLVPCTSKTQSSDNIGRILEESRKRVQHHVNMCKTKPKRAKITEKYCDASDSDETNLQSEDESSDHSQFDTDSNQSNEQTTNATNLTSTDTGTATGGSVVAVVDNYVIVKFCYQKNIKLYVGKVLAVDSDNVQVRCLRSKGTIGRFIWPTIDDDNNVSLTDIVRVLPPPLSERRGVIFDRNAFTACEKLE